MRHLKKFNEDFHPNMDENKDVKNDIDVLDPKFTDKNAEEFLQRLGVKITKSENGENVFIRRAMGKILYSFVNKEDCESFREYLVTNNIDIVKELTAEGARFPYQIILHRGDWKANNQIIKSE